MYLLMGAIIHRRGLIPRCTSRLFYRSIYLAPRRRFAEDDAALSERSRLLLFNIQHAKVFLNINAPSNVDTHVNTVSLPYFEFT